MAYDLPRVGRFCGQSLWNLLGFPQSRRNLYFTRFTYGDDLHWSAPIASDREILADPLYIFPNVWLLGLPLLLVVLLLFAGVAYESSL